jgi:hypothetical protein
MRHFANGAGRPLPGLSEGERDQMHPSWVHRSLPDAWPPHPGTFSRTRETERSPAMQPSVKGPAQSTRRCQRFCSAVGPLAEGVGVSVSRWEDA